MNRIQNAANVAANIAANDETDVCPSCNKPENIVCKCGHCGHEYEFDESESGGWSIVFLWLFVGFVSTFLIFSFCSWVIHLDDKGFDRTFIQYIGDNLVYFWKRIILKLI